MKEFERKTNRATKSQGIWQGNRSRQQQLRNLKGKQIAPQKLKIVVKGPQVAPPKVKELKGKQIAQPKFGILKGKQIAPPNVIEFERNTGRATKSQGIWKKNSSRNEE